MSLLQDMHNEVQVLTRLAYVDTTTPVMETVMEALEEGEDTNHIMVLPSNGGTNPAGEGGGGEVGGEKPGFQKPKPRMQVEIRQAPNKNEELNIK